MINEADFSALGLSEEMLAAVQAKGFETPTSIQRLTIPRLLSGENDIIAQSQTGTGKTAAFGLPILQQIEPSKEGVQSIILVPTRELAVQAAEELLSYNRERRLSITAIYGGAAMSEQLRRLSRGVDIVVGTPGRVLDHIHRGTLKLDKVRFLVLDEADEMLNMGFVEDVEEIMGHTGEDRRVLLFSATMPERIIRLSEAYMRNTEVLRVESQHLTADLTNQIYFEVREADKFDAMTRIIDIEPDFYGIVFCRTKIGVDEVATRLVAQGYSAEGLHGDVSQAQREKILRKFRDKAVNILVATDVAARGIDVSNLSHVINYSLPQDSESYVHRIGRTGRAGNQGRRSWPMRATATTPTSRPNCSKAMRPTWRWGPCCGWLSAVNWIRAIIPKSVRSRSTARARRGCSWHSEAATATRPAGSWRCSSASADCGTRISTTCVSSRTIRW